MALERAVSAQTTYKDKEEKMEKEKINSYDLNEVGKMRKRKIQKDQRRDFKDISPYDLNEIGKARKLSK